MKKLMIVWMALSLCACQQQTTTQNEKPAACDPSESCEETKKETKEVDFKEISMDEALSVFARQESAILFFGFKDCPWCQEAAPVLKEVAETTGKEVLYIKTRSDKEHELLYSDQQREQLSESIGAWMEPNEEEDNKLWLYVPLVIRVDHGVATEGHEGTVDTHDATKQTMTTEEKTQLEEIYTEILR
ncbi:MAG: conjugal transfer protein TraF [Erysipelotrichaceae bacterium]|nr:conjugal transfer protein TraF [Erysipelotrichaceae bacterium]